MAKVKKAIKAEWVETKKEYERDNSGKFILKKVTRELQNQKSKNFDTALKILGSFAIFLPLYLFYLNQKKETEANRTKLQVEAYTNLNLYLKEMLAKEFGSDGYAAARDKFNEQISKVHFINDSTIIKKLDTIQTELNYWATINETSRLADSLNYKYIDALYLLEASPTKVPYPYLKSLGRMATQMNNIDNILATEKIQKTSTLHSINYAFTFIKDSIWAPHQTLHEKDERWELVNTINERLKSLKVTINTIRVELTNQNAGLYAMMIKNTKF